jgi:HNH endonuclease/AP2 domain
MAERKKQLHSIEYLKTQLEYDELSGCFRWLVDRGPGGSRGRIGEIAGCKRGNGYWFTRLDGVGYLLHRLAFSFKENRWPKYIDHIDGNPSNNRWLNLREADNSQNHANMRLQKRSKSGFKGVSPNNGGPRWKAEITCNYKKIYLGTFDAPEEAHAAYCKAALELFGEFANDGIAPILEAA